MKSVKWAWPNILVAYFGLFCFGLLDNIRGPYFPEILNDLNLTDTQGSLFFVVPSLFGWVGSQMVPFLTPRLSAVQILRIGFLFVGLPFLAFLWLTNLSQLLILSAFFGLGIGVLNVAQHILIKEGAEKGSIRQLFSGLHSMYAGAALLAPLLAKLFNDQEINWRMGFVIAGILPICLFLMSFKWDYKKKSKESTTDMVSAKLYRGQFIYVAFMIAFYVSAELIISTRFVLYVRRHYEVSQETAPIYLMIFFLGLFLGRVLFTIFPLKKKSAKSLILFFLFVSLLVNLGGLLISPWILTLMGLTIAPIFAIFMNYLSDHYKYLSDSAMAYALGITAFIIMGVHYLVGVLTDLYGIHLALHLGPIVFLLSILLVFAHDKLFRKSLALIIED